MEVVVELDVRISKKYFETTTADDKSVGFDYQYYYFLYLLLNLEEGQSLGLEVKDDIHIESSNNSITLIQLKHSTQTNDDGKVINLRQRDVDLWKTIHNWINNIKDPADGRKNIDAQLKYINKTNFVLVSNKTENSRNEFLTYVSKLKRNEIDIQVFKTYITELHKKTREPKDSKDSDGKIKEYIKELCEQEETLLEAFIRNLSFELSQDDLISKIKIRIQKVKMIPENRVDDVFSKLDSNLRKDIYNEIKQKNKILISCDDFYSKYKICFNIGRVNKLPIRRSAYDLPSNLNEQLFIKQLLDIEAVEVDDFESMATLTYHKLLMSNNLQKWIQDFDLTTEEEKEFHQQSKLKWENTFNLLHRKSKKLLRETTLSESEIEGVIVENAYECLCEVKKLELRINDTIFDSDISNGEYYLLSDIPVIGWHLKWEEKYKKHE